MSFSDGVLLNNVATSSSSFVSDRSYSALIPSPISEWSDFLTSLENELIFTIPEPKNDTSSPLYINAQSYRPSSDAVMLTCGCILSEKAFLSSVQNQHGVCPICSTPTEILAPVIALRNIYSKIYAKRQQLGMLILSGSKSYPNTPTHNFFQETSTEPQLAQLQKANVDIDDLSTKYSATLVPSNVPKIITPVTHGQKLTLAEIFIAAAQIVTANAQAASARTLGKVDSLTISDPINTSHPSFISRTSSKGEELPGSIFQRPDLDHLNYTNINIPVSQFEQREMYYRKCFPTFRKQFQHNVNSRMLFPRSKSYISTAISPDTSKIAVCSEKKWSVYWTPEDFNDSPSLLCSGYSTEENPKSSTTKSKGKISSNIDSLFKSSTSTITPRASASTETVPSLISEETEKHDLTDWDHQIISLSNRYLAVAGTKGILRLYDLENKGKCVYHHQSKFNIRYMTISPNGTLIACAITGIKHATNSEQAMIVLHWLQLGDTAPLMTQYTNGVDPMLELNTNITTQVVEPVTITIPYKDVINCLSFSWDEAFLSCGTNLTSHIVIINVTNPHEPRMMLKTSRWTDKTGESEGVTSIEFFPRSRLFVVTSVAHNAYPMIIDSKIKSTSSESQMISKLSMLLRIEKVGSSIHKTAISPRNDGAVAFLDKNGLVYLMYASNTWDNAHKRIFVVTSVSSAPSYREAASMRFSPTGHALFIIDRKGNFYVQDFAAGSPQSAGMSRCRILA